MIHPEFIIPPTIVGDKCVMLIYTPARMYEAQWRQKVIYYSPGTYNNITGKA